MEKTLRNRYLGTKKRKLAATVSLAFITAAGIYFYIFAGLPNLSTLDDYKPNLVTKVYSRDGRVVAEFYVERRIVVPMEKIPSHVVHAFLAAEDAHFYEHGGLDYLGIMRAMYKNVMAGRIVQGGSTITQQVAKSFFLTPERTFSRKMKEAILAYRIEKHLTKDEILYLYLNQIYLGSGSYGVEAASETYFGKNVEKLDLAEAALLAGLPKSPSVYSPHANIDLARQRQELVITRMLEEGFITPVDADNALKKSLAVKPKMTDELWAGPYFTEHVRQYLEEKYGQEVLYKGGLRVHTTMDVEMQKAANSAVDFGLRAYDKRKGYRGAIRNIQEQSEAEEFGNEAASNLKKFPPSPGRYYKAIVLSPNPKDRSLIVRLGNRKGIISYPDLVWAKLYNPTDDPDGETIIPDAVSLFKEGDVVWVGVKKVPGNEDEPLMLKLEQEPLAEGALLAVETDTGFVRALVGGMDFAKSKFNRAVQAKRQPGSAFKPIIYAAALDKGYTPATVVMDSPIVFEAGKTESKEDAPDWKPRNFDEKFSGPTTVRDALAKSRNVITVKILKDIGVDYAGEYAVRLGITSPLAKDLSLALGSSAVSMAEMVKAFSTFANYGVKTEQIFVTKVTDDKGSILEENHSVSESVMNADTAYLVTNLLQGVVENGTGKRAKALGRPVAAKTGTTNNLNDAWFVGYVPGLAAASWIGFDSEKNLGKHETGSRAASPVWIKFMEQALANTPARNFSVPPGIEFVKIDSKTGLLAGRGTKEPIFEVFKEGTAPTAVSAGQIESPTDEFFLMDSSPTGKIAIPLDEGEEDLSD